MDSNEARVREVWERVTEWWDREYDEEWITAYVADGGKPIRLFRARATLPEAWSAAAAFTEQVIEEARQLREEIGFTISSQMSAANYVTASDAEDERGKWQRRYEVWSRMQTRLEAIYAVHTRGIKPEALEGKQ